MLSQRAQEKIDKYRAGYAAQGVRKAFLPAVVSTSGRIHGDLLRLLYLLADNKTKLHFRALGEAIDVDSEAHCCVGGGAGFSGACGPPSAWHALIFFKIVSGAMEPSRSLPGSELTRPALS